MQMDLNAKAAYIRGLMAGMDFDASSKNGRIIAAMMELLEEMAAQVTEHDNALDQVYEELEILDEDLDEIVADIYDVDAEDEDEEDEDAEDDEDMEVETLYEVTCPKCGTAVTVDEETLLSQDVKCPECGAAFEIEILDEEPEEEQVITEK